MINLKISGTRGKNSKKKKKNRFLSSPSFPKIFVEGGVCMCMCVCMCLCVRCSVFVFFSFFFLFFFPETRCFSCVRASSHSGRIPERKERKCKRKRGGKEGKERKKKRKKESQRDRKNKLCVDFFSELLFSSLSLRLLLKKMLRFALCFAFFALLRESSGATKAEPRQVVPVRIF